MIPAQSPCRSGRLVACAGAGGRWWLMSPQLQALGLRHGFTTRRGGVDVRAAADLAGLIADTGGSDLSPHLSPQPHGARVSSPDDRDLPADAHFSPPGGGGVAVRTADCLPLLLAGGEGVVAVHAGWRGLLAGVIPAAVARLGGGSRIQAAAVGAAISTPAFEVGPEVQSAFVAAGWESCTRKSEDGRFHVDLLAVAISQIADTGVPAERVDLAARCTVSEPDWFWSHRRGGPHRGHQAAWIEPGGCGVPNIVQTELTRS